MDDYKIYWRQLTPDAVIPTKRPSDSGFDIYTTENFLILWPGEKHLFKTGLAYAIDEGHWLLAYDRGSTGSRGIHTHCGICDQGYRGELFICLANDNPYPVVFTRSEDKIREDSCATLPDPTSAKIYVGHALFYPLNKAIAQLIPMRLETGSCQIASDEEWESLSHTERGEGKLGASGK